MSDFSAAVVPRPRGLRTRNRGSYSSPWWLGSITQRFLHVWNQNAFLWLPSDLLGATWALEYILKTYLLLHAFFKKKNLISLSFVCEFQTKNMLVATYLDLLALCVNREETCLTRVVQTPSGDILMVTFLQWNLQSTIISSSSFLCWFTTLLLFMHLIFLLYLIWFLLSCRRWTFFFLILFLLCLTKLNNWMNRWYTDCESF